jgi:hypothetical protein
MVFYSTVGTENGGFDFFTQLGDRNCVFIMKQSEVSIAKYCLVMILTSVIYIENEISIIFICYVKYIFVAYICYII